MNALSDGWQRHREKTFTHAGLDARARAEIERAFYAGADYAVDAMQGMNDAGLSLPFIFARQLSLWSSEVAAHDGRLTFQETP